MHIYYLDIKKGDIDEAYTIARKAELEISNSADEGLFFIFDYL